jgi:hypothetical protein
METTQVNTGGESGLDHLQSVESGPEIDVGGHSFEVITFGQNSVMDGKELKRFITAVERFIRSSMDYKKYLGFLKCEVGMNRCSVMGNIDGSTATIEMHHYPFTLFQICEYVIDKMVAENKNVNTFSVAKEVMRLHFENYVGLVPLSKSVHQMVHSGSIFIDLRQVFGNVKQFVDVFKEYIPTSEIEKLEQIVNLSKNNTGISESSSLLELRTESRVSESDINADFVTSLNVIVASETPEQDRR